MFPERWIICEDTNEHPVGIATDGQFWVALNPRFIKHILVLKIVKIVADVKSVNVKKWVVALYVQVIL